MSSLPESSGGNLGGRLIHSALSLYPGVAAALTIALAATFLGTSYDAPPLLFALMLGMILSFLAENSRTQPGIEWCSRVVLRTGVALLGFRVTTDQLALLGSDVLFMVIAAVVMTITVAVLLARWMGFNPYFGWLSGGAVAICGASAALAIAATLPNHPLKERATLFTVITVSVMSALAMILYPTLVGIFGLSPQEAGIFLGATIHDVAQVIGAGYAVTAEAGDTATVIKMLRVFMLPLVVIVLAIVVRGQQEATPADRPPLVPLFALVFIGLVVVNSTGFVPQTISLAANNLSSGCLVVAIAAIGIKTSLQALAMVGWRPVVLVLSETVLLAAFVLGFLSWNG